MRIVTTHITYIRSYWTKKSSRRRKKPSSSRSVSRMSNNSEGHVLRIRFHASKSWELKAKARNGWRDRNHWFGPWRNVTRVMSWWRRPVINLSILWAMLKVASTTAASVKSTTSTAAWGICGDAPTYSCLWISVCLKSVREVLTLRGHSCTYLNVGLFQDHASLKCPTTGSAMFSCQRPFAVSIGQP
jgi:hypothetical protein